MASETLKKIFERCKVLVWGKISISKRNLLASKGVKKTLILPLRRKNKNITEMSFLERLIFPGLSCDTGRR